VNSSTSLSYFYTNHFALKQYQPILLSLLSGLLLFIAWPMANITVAVFFAFIPLFLLEQYRFSRLRYFGLVYLALFVWNVSTTWWIWNSTMLGASLAIFVNSLLMCIPWMGFRYMNKRFSPIIGYSSFLVFWLTFEYIHLQDWGLSWPWLTLGNVFAGRTEWIQWYEFTGTSGGSLWILLVNILLFRTFFDSKSKLHELNWWKAAVVSVFVLPIILSLLITKQRSRELLTKANNEQRANVVVVQPNIDPYEKIATGTFEVQLQKLIRLSESKIDSNTALLIWPETALYSPNGFDELNLKQNFFLNPLFAFLQKHPQLHLFSGIESYRVFPEKVSRIARPIDGTANFYEVYNGSVLLDSSGVLSFYHKSMLVPGVETLPRFLLFLAPVFEKFGGTAAGYAGQKERTPVQSNHHYSIAPAICYESIYGEYMSRYIANGANIIAVITNDGWWGNTPGHKHHQLYAKLRAIETRKWVVRSANTGISCFIDPTGTAYQLQPWGKEAAIQLNILSNNTQTFFVRMGDILSKASIALSILFILFGLYSKWANKR
jgi:apolipoprotein N-acyltransferase